MKTFNIITAGVRKIEKVFSYLGVVLLLGMMFLGSADVLSRFLFSKPIIGTLEWSQIMQAGIVFLGWSYVQATKSHLSVDIVYLKFPDKIKKIVDIIILLLTILLFGFIMWKSFTIAMNDFQQGRLIATILVPIYPVKMLVPIGSFFLIVESIIQLVDQFSGNKGTGVHTVIIDG